MPSTKETIKNKLDKIWRRDDRVIMMLCFLVALVWWIAGTLSDIHRQSARVPVTIELPDGYALASPVPDEIRVELQGTGWDLIGSRRKMEDLKMQPSVSSTGSAFLTAQTIIQRLDDQITTKDFDIAGINTDGIILDIDNETSKRLPVRAVCAFELGTDRILKSAPSLNPDSVLITGPQRLLKNITALYTDSVNLGTLQMSRQVDVAINLPNPSLFTLSNEKVILSIGVEEFTQKAVVVPIELRPPDTTIRLIPDKVLCKLNVGLSRYDSVQATTVNFYVNTQNITSKERLIVMRGRIPPYVEYIDHSPKIIDFVIRDDN